MIQAANTQGSLSTTFFRLLFQFPHKLHTHVFDTLSRKALWWTSMQLLMITAKHSSSSVKRSHHIYSLEWVIWFCLTIPILLDAMQQSTISVPNIIRAMHACVHTCVCIYFWIYLISFIIALHLLFSMLTSAAVCDWSEIYISNFKFFGVFPSKTLKIVEKYERCKHHHRTIEKEKNQIRLRTICTHLFIKIHALTIQ